MPGGEMRGKVLLTMVGGTGSVPPKFHLESSGVASDPPGASIFASIQNLGLRPEARKLPLEILVIDHVEKTPTAN
jgi:uncharacterized protein (TIGR03435 family)